MGGILSSSAGANHSGRRDIACDWFFFSLVAFPECIWLLCCTLTYLYCSFLSLLLIKKKVCDSLSKASDWSSYFLPHFQFDSINARAS